MVDYLGLIGGDDAGGENRTREVDKIANGLKSIARDFKIPVVALCQLSRRCHGHHEPPLRSGALMCIHWKGSNRHKAARGRNGRNDSGVGAGQARCEGRADRAGGRHGRLSTAVGPGGWTFGSKG